jgi:hypothetical protein
MNVTAIRKNGANGDPLREALAVAITKAKKAEAEYERHREAVGRARELVRTSKAKLESASATIEAAKETDVQDLAEAISTGGSSTARALRKARTAETERAFCRKTFKDALSHWLRVSTSGADTASAATRSTGPPEDVADQPA